MTAFVLAGGLGTRIAELYSGLPKAMIPVVGRPFIDHVIDHLNRTGIGHVVICAGHKASMLREHVERQNQPGIRVVVEPEPLGTAGALAFARRQIDHPDETFLAINGDTFAEFDEVALLSHHRALEADATLACYRVEDASARGTVKLDGDDRVLGFSEKAHHGPGLVSGGVYALEPRALEGLSGDRAASLELDVFPELLARGRTLGGWRAPGSFWDMGTPEGLRAAEEHVGGDHA